jgi:hypothetical protein
MPITDFSGVDDDTQYRVQLLKVIKLEHTALTPVTENIVKGSVLKLWPVDAVDSFSEYVPGPA